MGDKVKILLVEDEFILATELSNTLTNEGYQVVAAVDNGHDAVDFFTDNEVDLVLCDINIYGEWDGIETAKRLQEVKPVPLIYLTALADSDTLERAKNTFPAAYIHKPYNLTNLRVAIELAINNFAIKLNPNLKVVKEKKTKEKISGKENILQVNNNIFIKQNYQFVKFPLNDILYMQADNIYTNIYTSAKKYVLRESMKNVLERLEMDSLVRVHRSYSVNMDKIDSFNEHDITIGEKEIPLGRSYKDDFMKYFMFR